MNIRIFIYILGLECLLLIFSFLACQSINNFEIENKKHLQKYLADQIIQHNKKLNIDYKLIDSLLDNKNIVILGEQQHADGSTQKLYSQLIRHLYKKGFNTLFLETSFYNTHRFWEGLEQRKYNDFTKSGIYPFWKNANQTKALRDTIAILSQKRYPLYLKGIDFQSATVFAQHAIYDDLMSHMKTVPNFIQAEFKHTRHMLTNRFGPVLYFNAKGEKMDKNRKAFLAEFLKMQNLIKEKQVNTASDSIYCHYINNLYHFYYARMYLSGDKYNQLRDSMMFENLMWQIKKNDIKKAIVWTANAHASNDDESWLRFGARVKQAFHHNSFTILSSSFSGFTTNISSGKKQEINPAISTSIEYSLAQRIPEKAFLQFPENIRTASAEMRFYGHNNLQSEWFSKCDAFIFIRNMKPSEY